MLSLNELYELVNKDPALEKVASDTEEHTIDVEKLASSIEDLVEELRAFLPEDKEVLASEESEPHTNPTQVAADAMRLYMQNLIRPEASSAVDDIIGNFNLVKEAQDAESEAQTLVHSAIRENMIRKYLEISANGYSDVLTESLLDGSDEDEFLGD